MSFWRLAILRRLFLTRDVVNNNDLAKRFIDGVLGCKMSEPFTGLVVLEDGHVLGAVVLNNYEKGLTVDLTVAGYGAFGIREVRTIARYIFEQLGCQRITAVIRPDNYKVLYTLVQLGFKQEGRLRRRYKDCDGLLFGITREEQRAIRLKNG
jgi:RimJ/RimL family protein N-acetyltransferase